VHNTTGFRVRRPTCTRYRTRYADQSRVCAGVLSTYSQLHHRVSPAIFPLPFGNSRLISSNRWTSTIAWQAGNAQGIFIVGSLIQTIILVNDENYGFPSWQGALLAIAAMCIAYSGVVFGSKALPYWQNAVFALHIMGYFAYVVPSTSTS